MFGILCLSMILLYIPIALSDGSAPTVMTSLGMIIGSAIEIQGTPVNQFLSIPYAEPPTGERRFKKPEPVRAWSEPLFATLQPPACIQYTQNPFPWYDDGPGKSEDCLFLNIWSPADATPTNKKAVLYWIFAGGFFVGSIRQKFYWGDALSAVGDIIVVTVNYRLGILGFLYSGTEDALGNVGLWDILAGLQWVNNHIENFGGDVSRITIAGESAGSIAVGLLSVSPLARDLYTRQIMQSGSPAYTIADNNTQNMARGQKIAELVNCANNDLTLELHPKEVVDCLRSIDPMTLSAAEASLIPHSSRSFLPQYGDEILPENPRLAIINRRFQNSGLLIGNSKDEGSFQITTSNPDIFGFFGEKSPQINKSTAHAMLRKIFATFPAAEAVVKHYLPENVEENDYDYVRYQLYTASGDFSLLCPTVYYAEKFAENGNNVYSYLWSHRPSDSPWAPWMGTTHFSDVSFLFGLPIKYSEDYEPEEVELSMDFIHKWSHFVKYGKPMEQWPLHSKDNPIFLYLANSPKDWGVGLHKENCDFFRPYFGF